MFFVCKDVTHLRIISKNCPLFNRGVVPGLAGGLAAFLKASSMMLGGNPYSFVLDFTSES